MAVVLRRNLKQGRAMRDLIIRASESSDQAAAKPYLVCFSKDDMSFLSITN
jgi:hypothetical protein